MAYLMIPAREVVVVTEESGSMFRVKSAMCSPMASIEARSAAFARNDRLDSCLRSSCCSSATFSLPHRAFRGRSTLHVFVQLCRTLIWHDVRCRVSGYVESGSPWSVRRGVVTVRRHGRHAAVAVRDIRRGRGFGARGRPYSLWTARPRLPPGQCGRCLPCRLSPRRLPRRALPPSPFHLSEGARHDAVSGAQGGSSSSEPVQGSAP